jgi:hypothetical protein
MSKWHKCKVETCDRPAWKKGLCGAHASRLRHSGELRPEVPIRRGRTGYSKVDNKR